MQRNNFSALKYGIFSEGTVISGIIIRDNIVNSSGDGIYAYARGDYAHAYVYNLTFQNNRVFSCGDSGVIVQGRGYVPTFAYDALLIDNIISADTNVGIKIIEVRTNITSNSVAYNKYGITYEGSTGNLARFNDIYRNSLYGIYVSGGSTVNAEHNYWGNETGPYHESINPEGTGNRVNGDGVNLDFIPWLTSPIGTINERPVAVLTADKTEVGVNEIVTFDASQSYDDGKMVYYFFDFGDGTKSTWTTTSVVKHKYTKEGKYNVTLIVMDDFGVKSIDSNKVYITITVVPEFPQTLILPLLMIITTLTATVLAKRKNSKTRIT